MHHNIRLDFDTPALFSLSSLKSKQEAVFNLSVTNLSASDEIPLTLEIASEPAFFSARAISLGVLAPTTKRIFPDLSLVYDRTFLSYLQENVSAQIFVRLISNGNEILTISRTCDILRHDAWGGVHFMPELLSCVVSPAQTQIQDVVRVCKQKLQRNKILLDSDGYQNSLNLEYVRSVSRTVFSAAYDAVRSCGIIFSIQPAELTRRGNLIQLPETTLAKKSGNALDAALLFASCIESLSLNPIILLSGSHILIGGFLDSQMFSSPIVDQLDIVKQALDTGALCIFDATALAKGTSVNFGTACQLGDKACRDLKDFYLLIDIKACRNQEIFPLDNRVMYEDGIHFEKSGFSDEADIFFNDTAIEEASPVPFSQNLRDIRRFLGDFSAYNHLIALPDNERVRILITEPERFYDSLDLEHKCALFSYGDAPFGFRMNETQAAVRLDEMDKRASSLGAVVGEVCLVFGTVKWVQKDAQGEAPLFILPLKLHRDRGRLFTFESLFVRPKINATLIAFLLEHFAVDLSALREISSENFEDYLNKAFLHVRSELGEHPSLTCVEQEVFFALLNTSANDKLSALSPSRLEAHPLAHAVCANESVGQQNFKIAQIADPAPVSMPTPFPLDRESLGVVAAVGKQDYSLVRAPLCGGKTSLGVAATFASLNYSENTVLYITGEHGNARDVLPTFEKAGIDDLTTVLSLSSPSDILFSMRETQMFPAEDYFTLSAEFSDEQKKLLCYEAILSEKLSCGITAEEAIYCYDHVRSAVDCLHFSPEIVGKMDEKTVSNHQQVIRNLTTALSSISSPVSHPLRYVQARGFSYEIKAESVRLLAEYSKKFKEYITFLRGSCAGLFPRAKIRNEYHEKAFLNLLRMIGDCRGINACFFEREIAASDLAKAETIFAYGKECCEMRTGPLCNLTPSAFDLPVKEMIVAWRDAELKRGGARKKNQREIEQKLLACCSECKELNVLETLYQIEKFHNYRAYLFENAALIQRLFGVDILAPQNDTTEIWTKLAELCRDCVTFDRQLSSLAGQTRDDAASLMRNFTQEDAERAASLCNGILELKSEMEKVRDRCVRYLEIDYHDFCSQNRDNLYDEIPKLLKELSGGMDSFQQWTEWLNSTDVAKATGFEQILEAIDGGLIRGDTLEDAYARAFFMALCEYVFLKYPVLDQLRGSSFDEKLNALYQKREKIFDYAKQDIRGKHLRRYTSFVQDSGLDIGRKARLTPALFATDTYALTCRYPVLLANAEDAVRFLAGTPTRFSLLILDDAQTLSMPSALALIPRAEKVVILGTPSSNEEHVPMLENINQAVARSRERIPSFWKSACVALTPYDLKFSKRQSSALANMDASASGAASSSFPFAKPDFSVREVRTPGLYDPITFVNLPEVMQTVEETLSILREHRNTGEVLSLGICASTQMQKLLILQTLAKRLREEPELYSVLRNSDESFYVCSLEDEPLGRRDHILWSLTVAATKSLNIPTRAFPLLSDLNGARRIESVLGSARKELCVVHSIHADSLEFLRMQTDSQSVFRRVCKELFNSSERTCAIVDDSFAYDNPIAERIAHHLRNKGCNVCFALRSGNFVIDLIARLPGRDDFALAILLDESVYSVCGGHVLGEIDLMNQLRTRGFTPVHIRATDWFENDQLVLDAIVSKLPESKKLFD